MLSIQPNRTQIEPIIKQRLVFIVLFTVSSIMVQAQDDCGSCVKGNLTSRQGINGTEQENFIFDYLGSYLRLYTDDGTEVFSAEYDFMGRLINIIQSGKNEHPLKRYEYEYQQITK